MKKLIKLSVIVLAATSMLILTSCAKKPPVNSESSEYAGGSTAEASQTYGAPVPGYRTDADGFRLNSLHAPSNQTYYFAFDSSVMRSKDMQALLVQANYLATHPNTYVRLEGNTDNRGSREYNIGLGWHRDQTVARILEQQGVHANQIQMVSYGKENPAVPGNNEHAWALNRRVEFIYK